MGLAHLNILVLMTEFAGKKEDRGKKRKEKTEGGKMGQGLQDWDQDSHLGPVFL